MFNIEDDSLKKQTFHTKKGQEEQLRASILEQTIYAGQDNTTSNQVVWAAAAGVVFFALLFGILSKVDYSISLYNTTIIAQQDAEEYYNQEIDELSLFVITQEINSSNNQISTDNLTDDEITTYLTYTDVSTYDLSQAYNEY